jgi:hypothetical protein
MIVLSSNDSSKDSEIDPDKVVIQKIIKENIIELITSFINVSNGKYFGNISSISSNIEKLNIFFNSSNKKEKYIKALNLRGIAKKATFNLNLLLNDKDEILKKIFDDVDFEIIKKFLDKHKNFIKKEIIREALTGKAKFGTREKYIATHVLTYDDKKYTINFQSIDDNYIDMISSQIKIKFGFKGSSDKSSNTLQISSESFFGDIKDKIGDVFDNVKTKSLKIISSVKKKSIRLLNFFGIKIKINNVTMPQWIIDKL